MKTLELSNIQIADLCRQLALLMHAGVGLGDGLTLLCDEEPDSRIRDMLSAMARSVDSGNPLSIAFRQADCFPHYVTGLIRVAESVGRLEDTLNSLYTYYENRERMQRFALNALTYPIILFVLMTAVIAVLLVRVLPVFNDIYASLGGTLGGVAGGLLLLGQALKKALPALGIILAALLLFGCLVALCRPFRSRVLSVWRSCLGDRGIARSLNNARFAQALSMGVSSGMPIEQAAQLAEQVLQDSAAVSRCRLFREQLEQGAQLADALSTNRLMSPAACRLLTLAMRSGEGDTVMTDIAQRMLDDAQQEIEAAVSKLEPALVLATSLMVGAILLSVMLPLMDIMSVLG